MKSYNLFICRRATAFLLLFLLSFTLLSPASVHAEDKTYAKDFVSKVHYSYTYKGKDHSINYFYDHRICTDGKLVCVTYFCRDPVQQLEGFAKFYLSTSPIYTLDYNTGSSIPSETELSLTDVYNGVYYVLAGSTWLSNSATDFKSSYSGLVNIKNVGDSNWLKNLKSDIDNGYFDLTKDNYMSYEELEKTAIYNSSLDLTSFGAHAYQKWSVKKEPNNGGWNFITDEEAGTRYDWTYKTELEGSYIKFTYYGNYYEKMFDPVYTDGVLSLSGDGQPNVVSMSYARSLKEKMIYTKADLFNALYAKYGYSKIYAFETKYVYAQCFGYVDGEFCRSRTYRVNYDMVKEDGDTWILEPTGSDPLPSEYVPDDSDPTPRPSDPDPAPGEWKDTTPNPLPPNPTNPDFPTDNSILNALKWLYETLNGLKDSLGSFPSLVNSVFGFLPQPVILLLGASIVLVVIMRFAGR